MRNLIEKWRFRPVWTILAFSLLVHLPGITNPLLDYHAYRQCQTASMARNYVRHGMRFLKPELDTEGRPQRAGTEFPIYSYLLALLYKVFGVREILGRLLSAAFAAWGAVFLYLFVRSRLGEARALWSGLVMCSVPIHVYFTRTVQPEPMALWGLLGFLYYFDRWLQNAEFGVRNSEEGSFHKKNHLPHPAFRVPNWFLAVLFGALAPLLKLPFIYVLVPLWAYLGWERYGFDAGRRLGFLASLAMILGLTWSWYHYARTAPVGVLPLSAAEHWENLRPVLTLQLWKNHFISRLPELCATYPGLLFAIAGAAWMRKNGTLRMWAVWFGATVFYILLLGKYGQIHRYTELPFAPVMAVFIASGIVWLWEGHRESRVWRIALAIGVIGIPLHTALRIKHWYRWEYPWVFQAREVVGRMTAPEDLLITQTHEHPVLLYYLDRYGFAPALEETGLAVIPGYRALGARFFLTPVAENWETRPEWAAYFNAKGRLLYRDPDYLLYRLE